MSKMVIKIITLSKSSIYLLDKIKNKFKIKSDSDAINKIIEDYYDNNTEYRKEFIEHMKNIESDETIEIKDFKAHFE